jgi:hypothetical protein
MSLKCCVYLSVLIQQQLFNRANKLEIEGEVIAAEIEVIYVMIDKYAD